MRGWVVGMFAASLLAASSAFAPSVFAPSAFADDAAIAAVPVWNWTYSTIPQFVGWSSNRGWPNNLVGSGHGSQFYAPVLISGSTTQPNWNFQFDAHTGYVYGQQSVGAFSGSVSTATDTTLSGTATYTGFNGWQPYATVMVNLPTGQSVLANTSTWARMDPDLVPIAVYGEGFNVGPTLGVTVPVNSNFTVVVNGGYTWRGKYWKEGGFDPLTMTTMLPNQLIDPSGVWTGAMTAVWTQGPLTLQGTGSYAVETSNYVDGLVAYRTGPRTTISGSGSYMWNDHWTTSVDGYFVHIDRNDIPQLLNPFLLTPEMLDSNNNIFRINANQMYRTPFEGGTLTVGPVGSFMFREHNSWDPTSASFVPAKTRYSVGASATYAPSSKTTVNLRVEHVWINEDSEPAAAIPVVNGDGWLAMLGLTFNTP